MKIAVVCSNGKVGRLIVKEALNKGLEVTGFARSDNKSEAKSFVKKDIFDLTNEDLKSFDVVIDAFGIWNPDELNKHTTSLLHLADILKGTKTRLMVVGGAGSLYMNKEHSLRLKDLPSFPKEYFPVASAMANSLDELKKVKDVHWLYVTPAADFEPEGTRTGKYIISNDEYTTNKEGESKISYADYALGIIDLILNSKLDHKQVSIIGE